MKKVFNKVFGFVSGILALLSLFAVSFSITSFLNPSDRFSNNNDENLLTAVAITFLVSFIYVKLAKKFNL
jgi:hypothetical protein